jgi:Predicted aminopeptidase
MYKTGCHFPYTLPLIVCLLAGSGCSSLAYYAQSIRGHFEIMHKRQSIDTLLASHGLPADTSTKLASVQHIRDFAVHRLGLPQNDSYTDYVDTGRDYVVWNVFAVPELSLQIRQWCFLITGCLSYRGYFSTDNAYRLATGLKSQGYDVYIGGVTAYSTLGWFADPVLNTMLRRDTTYLARVIFHELAHQKLYFRDHTEFNEAFADTVADAGVRLWLDLHGTAAERQKYDTERSHKGAFTDLVMKYRARLDELYQSTMEDAGKRQWKAETLSEMRHEYQRLSKDWEDNDYDPWFTQELNNAKLMAVVTYRDYLPGFNALLTGAGNDFIVFYTMVERMRYCSREQREAILLSGATDFEC